MSYVIPLRYTFCYLLDGTTRILFYSYLHLFLCDPRFNEMYNVRNFSIYLCIMIQSVLNVMSTRLMSSVYKRNCHKSIIHNHQLCLDKEASWIPSHTFQGNSHDQQFAKSFMFIKHEQARIITTCTTCLYRCFSLALVFIYD